MENRFDFELEGKDDISGTLKNLEEVVKKMLPALDQAGKKLKLGGQETADDLDTLGGKLSQLSAFAKSGVQYFGDMVPPLKMVGGLAERYGGVLARLGGVGVVAYGAVQGVKALAGGLSAAGQEAYNLGVQSKNSGMSVHDLTQVAGAMEILGSDTDTAR
ncbi:TPA: lytic transglycosylase domain-containing protein, partial [Serratia marcescens]